MAILVTFICSIMFLVFYYLYVDAESSSPSTNTLMPEDIQKANPDWVAVRRLGDGAFAEVYLVEDRSTNRRLAVKVLRDSVRGDEDMSRRFCDEVIILHAASGLGVVPELINWSGPGTGRLWYAMEFIEPSWELKKYIDRLPDSSQGRTIRRSLARLIVKQVSTIHRIGIIHRDLCPRNMLVTGDRSLSLRIIDFGMAKFQNIDQRQYRTSHEPTQVGLFVGKSAYAAPEALANGTACAGEKADVFSTGVLICQVMTGFLPWEATPGRRRFRYNANALVDAGLSRQGANLVFRCLSDAPFDRPSVSELFEAL
jgi:serine/threonine protein kinase